MIEEPRPKLCKPWKILMPFLIDGAAFVLFEERKKNKVRVQVKLVLKDGTIVPGKYSYPKNQLERLGRLKESRAVKGFRTWTLRET